ncbi:MAG: hypothetical protein AAB215_07355 [Planctomycetota bacterium]
MKIAIVRQSVSLPAPVARRVRLLARASRSSASRTLVRLIEDGLETRAREKQRFLELADRLARSEEPAEQSRLKADLARLTFGD